MDNIYGMGGRVKWVREVGNRVGEKGDGVRIIWVFRGGECGYFELDWGIKVKVVVA